MRTVLTETILAVVQTGALNSSTGMMFVWFVADRAVLPLTKLPMAGCGAITGTAALNVTATAMQEKGKTMTNKERLIELLQHSPTDVMGNHGVGAMADHLIINGVVFKDQYEDMEERMAHQRARAQTAEDFVCKLCAECEWEEDDGIATMIKKCCNWFPECKQFKLRSRWIPVAERLPEHGKVVLVCGKRGAVYTAWCNSLYKNPGWHKLNSRNHYCDPTHWMPLPEPPKED